MHISDSDIPQLDDASLLVLRSYAESAAAARQADEEFSGWTNRLMTVEGIESASLTQIHGQLIAFGCLKFEMSNRDVGMQYQLSQMARSILAGANRGSAEGEEDDREEEAHEDSVDQPLSAPTAVGDDDQKRLPAPPSESAELERAA